MSRSVIDKSAPSTFPNLKTFRKRLIFLDTLDRIKTKPVIESLCFALFTKFFCNSEAKNLKRYCIVRAVFCKWI